MLEGVNCTECHVRGLNSDHSNCPKCHGTDVECPTCGHGWDPVRKCCTNPKCSDYRREK